MKITIYIVRCVIVLSILSPPLNEINLYMDVTQRESLLLAPFAMFSAKSAGRRYPEPEHPYRGPYQRDRDRILHSAAFRRLSGKMQVFTGDMGDYHRTRLTHTMEVASVARTMARVLRLNEDLVESLALLHDIGHPPFGHAGEDALAECLREEGGFSHNQFALTLVEELEIRYPEFPGLNLSQEILDGQLTRTDKTASAGWQPLLEVQLVDLADSIAYDAHDIDDAMVLGLVHADDLLHVPLASRALHRVHQRLGDIPEPRQALVRELIDIQVGAVLEKCSLELEEGGWASSDEAHSSGYRLELPEEIAAEKRLLEKFLYTVVYRHEDLLRVRGQAQHQLAEMFQLLVSQPDQLSRQYQTRVDAVGLPRAVADYLGGMTDRYCYQRYSELTAGKNQDI